LLVLQQQQQQQWLELDPAAPRFNAADKAVTAAAYDTKEIFWVCGPS
jgi:hypothetical protein